MQMSAENWRRVKTLYQRAVETVPEKRADFLSEICAGDEDLRREVEEMLAFENDSEDVFDYPVFDAVKLLADDAEILKVGERIENYAILREIGRGGMGVVYLAERIDGLFEQKVALKIIKRGMDTDAILRRFTMERQILAALEHPNIARLLDGGTTVDGLPYFVLEYVEGLPVDKFCEAENLSLNERLRLFRKICDAVSYAHQNLVVHRDLKPSNILINKKGEPKLLDFGIAKLLHAEPTGETEFTETGTRMLTPEYASPEQIGGERVTTQSDVYSLGVLLSKLVSNSEFQVSSRSGFQISNFKFQKVSPQETGNLIAETDEQRSKIKDQKPKTENQRPKTDLQAILQTALREDISKRYSSVEQFSDDIRRFLEGLPISARKDSFAYRTAKFVYRNQAAVFASVFMMLALIGATAFSVWQMRKANAAQIRAEQRFREVRKLANAVIFDYHDKIQNLSGSTEVRGQMLSDSLEYLDSLSQEAIKDNGLLNEIGAAYLKIGDAQGKPFAANAGDTKSALESYRKAERIFLELLEREPENREFKINLSRAYSGIGKIEMREMNAENSISAHQKSIELRRKLYEENPSDANLRGLLAESFFNLGDAILGKTAMISTDAAGLKARIAANSESLELFRRALELQSENYEIARCFQRIGFRFGTFADLKKNYNAAAPNDSRSAADFYREAVNYHRKAIGIAESIQSREPENAKIRRFVADERMIIAEPLIGLEKFDEAEKNLSAAQIVFEELAAKDAANVEAKRDLVNLYDRTGRLFVARKNPAEAVKNYKKATQILSEIVAANPTESDKVQLKGLQWWIENAENYIVRQPK